MNRQPIILASTSVFRRDLLRRLRLDFSAVAPDVDESPRSGEAPENLVARLAEAKAREVAGRHPDSLVIGADQVACIRGQILGKPGSRSRAIDQLEQASGRKVSFFTGLCVFNAAKGTVNTICEPFHVHFRKLTAAQIESYIDREQPLNCAGSFKSEGLGIALFDRLEGEDPSALIGLPLIRLVRMLETEGIVVL